MPNFIEIGFELSKGMDAWINSNKEDNIRVPGSSYKTLKRGQFWKNKSF